MIDLRSDTVTHPTDAMRKAMADAEVGDDVYREDPTVNRLQEAAADRFGKQAALLCPSGVMCNQLWLRVLARPGTEVIVEADAHVVNYEGGAGALLAGVQFRTLPGERGLLDPAGVASAIRPDHSPLTPTSLVCVEQTHNRGGGTVYPLERLQSLRAVCGEAGVSLYMDGARVFNACVAADVAPGRYGALVDGLMFSVSKALSAPVGSLMVGDADRIAEAMVWRRRYGGAMRQAGVLAAAGLVALEQMVDRLADDHANARLLAEAAKEAHPDGLDLDRVQTNIVCIEQVDASAVVVELRRRGVLAGALDPGTVRLVTHPGVSAVDCQHAADALRAVLAET
ncbi:MAG: aminotransferase class I/II-fold pyridoxal phosphate-dependent enzyme [Actinomycetota bacterium]|nr:aminotransferase class I/II-fold pyridoxal phosphate-dependent enzyme [Actinomycetota bacterium]